MGTQRSTIDSHSPAQIAKAIVKVNAAPELRRAGLSALWRLYHAPEHSLSRVELENEFGLLEKHFGLYSRGVAQQLGVDNPDEFALVNSSQAAYPVDSGFPRCSVLSDRIGAVARADTDGEGSVARGVPEVVSRRGELRGIFIQVALAGWFCVSRLWRAPRGWAEKPTAFA